jgi:hypothetical protein
MRNCVSLAAGVMVLGLAAPVVAEQATPAGRIKTLSGEAFIVHAGQVVPATLGREVYESDRVRTGSNGRVGLTLLDDTRVAIGPKSEVSVDSFRYEPAEGSLGLALKFVEGVAVYVSGKIAKLAPDAVRLETPAAIVGVRGTTIGVDVGAE